MNLQHLGWHPFHEAYFADYTTAGLIPARVAIQYRDRFVLYTEAGECWGEISGKFRHHARSKEDFPAVGDWVAIERHTHDDGAIIHHLLPRRTKFSRKVAGADLEEQIIAANIDIIFIVMGLDDDYNLRRLERFLSVAWESGAQPIVILNKTDLCTNLDDRIAEIETIARGSDIIAASAKRHEGLSVFTDRLPVGTTGVLIGSSGVGKSTIINALLGTEQQRTQDVRDDDSKGRHTTTHRELLFLKSGGMLIDSPGLRELQLWGGSEMLTDSFDDVLALAEECKFRDCAHESEPGCAVHRALEDGTLEEGRWQSYLKLRRELKYLERRVNVSAARKEKERWKKISKDAKIISKRKRE